MDDLTDQGHIELLKDIEALLEEAKRGEFHDFANEKYATPKMELYRKLQLVSGKVQAGDYDN